MNVRPTRPTFALKRRRRSDGISLRLSAQSAMDHTLGRTHGDNDDDDDNNDDDDDDDDAHDDDDDGRRR